MSDYLLLIGMKKEWEVRHLQCRSFIVAISCWT